MTGIMYLRAMRHASRATQKQSPGELAASTGSGASRVAAEERLEQVGLLGLGRQPGRGTAALDVDDDQRQLDHDREADGLALERHARARWSW